MYGREPPERTLKFFWGVTYLGVLIRKYGPRPRSVKDSVLVHKDGISTGVQERQEREGRGGTLLCCAEAEEGKAIEREG